MVRKSSSEVNTHSIAGSSGLSQEQFQSFVRNSALLWFEIFGWVLNKLKQRIQPQANYVQNKIHEAITYQEENGLPVRVVVLKPRQKGCSTYSTAFAYAFSRRVASTICILGHEYKSAYNLLSMVKNYMINDEFPWGNSGTSKDAEINFSNGSKFLIETTQDAEAGRSGTFQGLIATEAAHYKKSGANDGEKILGGILKCIADSPGTFVIMESTANGRGGVFYNTYEDAVTLEEARGGRVGNGFIKVFAPWFKFEETSDALNPNQEFEVANSLSKRERELMSLHSLSIGQVAWRRRNIKTQCQGSDKMFDQEEPSDDASCWLASGRPRFHIESIEELRRRAASFLPEYGSLDEINYDGPYEHRKRPIFSRSDPNDSWLAMWERPKIGHSYLISVDTAKGVSQTEGDDPDCHAAFVLRRGFRSPAGNWCATKQVARIVYPCRIDMDLLAVQLARMSRFWGGCPVAVESNNTGFALLVLLKEMTVPLHQKEIINLKSGAPRSFKLGFETNKETRPQIIEEISRCLREVLEQPEVIGGVDIMCPHILDELSTFEIGPTGRAEAREGFHDDDVMALGIGLCCINGAVPYKEEVVRRQLPREIALLMSQQETESSGSYRA